MEPVPLRVLRLPSFDEDAEAPKSWPAKARRDYADARWVAGRLLARLDGRLVAPDALHASTLLRSRAEREAEPPPPLGALLGAILDFRPFRLITGLDDPDPEGHACLIHLPRHRFEILALCTDLPDKRLVALRRDREGRLARDLSRLGRAPGLCRAVLARARAL